MALKFKLRWFQFNLQTFLVAITVVCVALGYVVYKRSKAEEARLAAESLKIRGVGYAFTEAKMPGNKSDWSVAILGDDSYEHIAALWIERPQFHDSDLRDVAKLRFLKVLILKKSDISDAGLRHISSLSQLEQLSLSGCQSVTGDGLQHVKRMRRLNSLWLDGTMVDDQGLESLEALNDLEFLDLSGTEVTDAGLNRLAKLPALKRLHLGCAGVSDAGLAKLRGMQELEGLNLNGSSISDSGLIHLQDLPQLKELHLIDTGITDEGLAHLQIMKQLEVIRLAGTRTTLAGIQNLQRELPKLRIVRNR